MRSRRSIATSTSPRTRARPGRRSPSAAKVNEASHRARLRHCGVNRRGGRRRVARALHRSLGAGDVQAGRSGAAVDAARRSERPRDRPSRRPGEMGFARGRREPAPAHRGRGALMDATTLGAATAFAAGAVSFVSPCVLPLVPAYMSYITGQSLATNAGAATISSRVSAAALSVLFVRGFSTVFIALGASATALSRVLLAYRYEAGIAGGVLVTLFGLVMLIGVERVPFLRRDAHF